MLSPNPYAPAAPPAKAADAPAPSLGHLAIVHRMYWWVGVIGITVCGIFLAIAIIPLANALMDMRGDNIRTLASVIAFCFHAFFFNYCRLTAHRLAATPSQFRRRSRLVGFVMATFYFPILTAPGLYCVWKIDKHFENMS